MKFRHWQHVNVNDDEKFCPWDAKLWKFPDNMSFDFLPSSPSPPMYKHYLLGYTEWQHVNVNDDEEALWLVWQ